MSDEMIWAPWPAGERRLMSDLDDAVVAFRALPEAQRRLFTIMCLWPSPQARALLINEPGTLLRAGEIDGYLRDFIRRDWVEPYLGGPGCKLNYFGRCMGKAMGMELA